MHEEQIFWAHCLKVRVIADHQVKGPNVNLGTEWAQGFVSANNKKANHR
jgi:hypothetical protein